MTDDDLGAALIWELRRLDQPEEIRKVLAGAVSLEETLAQVDEAPQALVALRAMDRNTLECLLFEPLYRTHPEWQINGWPAWDGVHAPGRAGP
jgi:hypothetical protein